MEIIYKVRTLTHKYTIRPYLVVRIIKYDSGQVKEEVIGYHRTFMNATLQCEEFNFKGT